MPVIGTALLIGGAVVGAASQVIKGIGELSAGKKQQELANKQAGFVEETAAKNLGLQQQQAQYLREQTRARVGDISRAGFDFQNKAMASLAKTGIRTSSGSALKVLARTDESTAVDMRRTREEGMHAASTTEAQANINYQAALDQAELTRQQGEMMREQSKFAAAGSFLGAAGTLMSGAVDAYNFGSNYGLFSSTPKTRISSNFRGSYPSGAYMR